MTSWTIIDGRLPYIGHDGPTSSRFSSMFVEELILRYSRKGDVILDPFAGYGTTLSTCEKHSRAAFGFEPNLSIYDFVSKDINKSGNRLFNDVAQNIAQYHLPSVDLVVTSLPFSTFNAEATHDKDEYLSTLHQIFSSIRKNLKIDAKVAIEIVNKRGRDGTFFPFGFAAAVKLCDLFDFEGELVICNSDEVEVTPGFTHSLVLVFRNRIELTRCEV